MTGFRASALRQVCQHCKIKFRPKRAGAEFCCSLCRAAWHRTRKKRVSATEAKAAAEALFVKRKQEALVVIDQFDRHQSIAGMLHQKAKARGFNVKFMATRIGVLAVEGCPGALRSAYDCLLWLLLCREIKTRSDDRELRALLSIPSLGGPFIAREAEKECRAVIEQGPPVDVSLFVYDVTPARAERWNQVLDNRLRIEFLDPRATEPDEYDDERQHDDAGYIPIHDSGDGFDGEFDPRDEPASATSDLPEDHGLMDHCDEFWR